MNLIRSIGSCNELWLFIPTKSGSVLARSISLPCIKHFLSFTRIAVNSNGRTSVTPRPQARSNQSAFGNASKHRAESTHPPTSFILCMPLPGDVDQGALVYICSLNSSFLAISECRNISLPGTRNPSVAQESKQEPMTGG